MQLWDRIRPDWRPADHIVERNSKMKRWLAILVVLPVLALSACEELYIDPQLERAAVGAVIGCAAGQYLVDGRCVEGAVVGAGVGVFTD